MGCHKVVNEASFLLLRLFLWLLPGILAFLSVQAFLKRRRRVALGLLVAALLLTAPVKPWVLGLLSLALGLLAAVSSWRKTAGRWLEELQLQRDKHRKP